MNLNQKITEEMKEYHVSAQERFSQNFLVDEKARNIIVSSVPFAKSQEVVEIGPGLGSLTFALVEKAKHVTAIDFDRDMVNVLSHEIKNDNFSLIQGDFLKCDLNMFHMKQTSYIGNLPYSITRDIIHKVLVDNDFIYFGFMVQSEVAAKLLVHSHSPLMNLYSMYLNIRGKTEPLLTLKPGSFYPSPKVDSEFLVFTPEDKGKYASEEVFEFLKAFLHDGKKNLNNNLKKTPYYEKTKSVMEKLGLPLTKRPHEIETSQMRKIIDGVILS